ncbi:MAG TPA: hypothetical protein VJ249_05760 [Candidatus Bathyarchaeia archaeon]|nr:hypothetical protein [Candidatus Bathyarchaeia archaeon]
MIRVGVFIHYLSAERLWDVDKPIPPVQIATNLNLVGVEKKSDDLLEVPFVFTINYNPAVAQISVKGRAHVTGEREELKQIHSSYTEKKPPPPIIIQSISNVAFIESIVITRTLNIPPPLPLPQIPPGQAEGKKPTEPSYRT